MNATKTSCKLFSQDDLQIKFCQMQGHLVDMVQKEVKGLLQSALEVALSVIKTNPTVLEGLAYLEGISKLC